MEETKGKKSEETKSKIYEPTIGLSRIRTIMKSTADTGPIPNEGLIVVSKAIKLFIEYLAKGAHKAAKSDNVTYEHLAKLVHDEEKLEFLLQIVPEKITVKEYKEILARGNEESSSDDNDESSEDEAK